MIEQIIKNFSSNYADREVVKIDLVHGAGTEGLYVVTAPRKNSDNLYEPAEFLYSVKTNKASVVNPAEDISAYTQLLPHLATVWQKGAN